MLNVNSYSILCFVVMMILFCMFRFCKNNLHHACESRFSFELPMSSVALPMVKCGNKLFIVVLTVMLST